MLGGVIGGYCASGRLKTATAPARVMTIDSTEAKIGRSMKKCENISYPFGETPKYPMTKYPKPFGYLVIGYLGFCLSPSGRAGAISAASAVPGA